MKPLFDLKEYTNAKSMDLLPLRCYYCNNKFYQKKIFIKNTLDAMKNKNKANSKKCRFCDQECFHKSKKNSITIECTTCKKIINRNPGSMKKSKNFFCSHSCAASYNNNHRVVKEYKTIKRTHTFACLWCGKINIVEWSKRKQKLCNRSCAASYGNKNRIIKKHAIMKKTHIFICLWCGKTNVVEWSKKKQKLCNRSCSCKYTNKKYNKARKAGIASSKTQVKRSKNEIYFAELCNNKFEKVLLNENIFNGWDADVIIEDHKIAILWNGKWHYEKITQKHLVKQVQNRDKIKIKEIKNKGYIPYVIKDMGKYNREFVEFKFNEFIKYCKREKYGKE